MSRQKVKFMILGIIFLFVLSACTKGTQEIVPEDGVETPAIPTPGVDTGVVFGKITSKATGKAPQANIYLSRNITAEQTEVPAMLSFSYQTNPRAQVDENGNFYFSDVPVGVYAITLWTPPNDAYFIPNETGQDYLWVVVKAGELLDMGEIQAP